jgi:WD40 repeat protein
LRPTYQTHEATLKEVVNASTTSRLFVTTTEPSASERTPTPNQKSIPITEQNIAGLEPAYTLVGHTGDVTEVVYSSDGSSITTSSEDGTIRVWNAEAVRGSLVEALGKLPNAADMDLEQLASQWQRLDQ